MEEIVPVVNKVRIILILSMIVSCQRQVQTKASLIAVPDELYIRLEHFLRPYNYKLYGDTLLFNKADQLYYKVLSESEKYRLVNLVRVFNSGLRDTFYNEVKCTIMASIDMIERTNGQTPIRTSLSFTKDTSCLKVKNLVDSLKVLMDTKVQRISPYGYINEMRIRVNYDSVKEKFGRMEAEDVEFTLWSALMFKDTHSILHRLDFDTHLADVMKFGADYPLDSVFEKEKPIKSLYYYKGDFYVVFQSGVIHKYQSVRL